MGEAMHERQTDLGDSAYWVNLIAISVLVAGLFVCLYGGEIVLLVASFSGIAG